MPLPILPPHQEPPPLHALELERHRDSPSLSLDRRPLSHPSLTRSASETRVVGYLPYWAEGYSDLRYDVLTDLIWFTLSLGTNGSIEDDNGYGGAAMQDLAATCHANGVRFHVCVELMGSTDLHTFLSSASAQSQGISNLLAAAGEVPVDGINIDFESLSSQDRDAFTNWILDLRAATPGLQLTLATPSVDWSGAWDYDVLAENTDGLFIMGYGYHWTGGDPGPLAPLVGSDSWGSYSLDWTIQDYLEWGEEANKGKFILGLPLYGNDWPSASHAVPGSATGDGYAVTYEEVVPFAESWGALWDEATSTPYILYSDGGQYRQLWYDDQVSSLAKAGLATGYGLGGFGFWALNYDDNDPVLWESLKALVTEEEPPPDDDSTPVADDDTVPPVDDDSTPSADDDTVQDDDSSPADDAEGGPHWIRREPGGCECQAGPPPPGGLLVWSFLTLLFLNFRRRSPRP